MTDAIAQVNMKLRAIADNLKDQSAEAEAEANKSTPSTGIFSIMKSQEAIIMKRVEIAIRQAIVMDHILDETAH